MEKMIRELMEAKGNEKDLENAMSIMATMMDKVGDKRVDFITTIERTEEGIQLSSGVINIDGLEKELRTKSIEISELKRQLKTLKNDLENRKNQCTRMGKRLEEKKHHIQALEKQIELIKSNVSCETLKSGMKIVINNDFVYGSIEDIGLSEEFTKLYNNGIVELKNGCYVIKGGTIGTIGTDKHGYSLYVDCKGEELEVQFCLLDEVVESGELSITII